MRQVTATEKYRAVNEGKLAKGEFVRQMRMAYPSLISQFNGYNDSVQILKNRGYISEKAGVDSYDSRKDLNISLESIERGVRHELAAKGIDATEALAHRDEELLSKIEATVVKNLKKDPLHYIHLISGESAHVDKNDKPKETKRGAGDVDTFNGLKKASLKENMYIDDEEWEKEMGRTPEDTEKAIDKEASKLEKEGATLTENLAGILKNLKAKYGDIPGINDILIDFAKMHGKDILAGADAETEFENYIDANYDRLNESEKADKDYDGDGKIESGEEEYKGSKDKAIKAALKESVKNIISKVLEEEVISEAATNNLANFNEAYNDFEGVPSIINDLENIVTDVEAYYTKTREKIQKIFDRVGQVTNDEGLKVGAFIAPSIESAFRKDLAPVLKAGLNKGVELPKVRTISQADIDAHNSGERPLGEEDKQTVFTPVHENKK